MRDKDHLYGGWRDEAVDAVEFINLVRAILDLEPMPATAPPSRFAPGYTQRFFELGASAGGLFADYEFDDPYDPPQAQGGGLIPMMTAEGRVRTTRIGTARLREYQRKRRKGH